MGHSQMLLSEAFKKKKKIEKKLFRFSTEQSQLKHQLKCINVEQREKKIVYGKLKIAIKIYYQHLFDV